MRNYGILNPLFFLRRLSTRQVLVSGFAGMILAGSLLLRLPAASATGEPLRYIDALFTATSAVCVTGLVVFDTGTVFSFFGELVVLVLIQAGGLGFMTFSTALALLMGKKIGLKERVLIQEAYNQLELSGLVRLVQRILLVTLIAESCGALLLFFRFAEIMPAANAVYYSIFHAVSAFCNAGFDLFGRLHTPFSSLAAFVTDWWVCLVIAALFITGGLGFPVLVEIKKRLFGKNAPARAGRLSLHTRLVLLVTIILTLGGFILFFLLEHDNPETLGARPAAEKVLAAFFQAATPRTAGFSTLETSRLKDITLFVLIFFMFVGASPSSTGGGIKTTTIGALLLAVWSTIRGRREPVLFERRLPGEVINKALTIVFIAAGLILLVTVALTFTENFPLLPLLFEVVSAFGTVGLSTGITPFLSGPGRILIIATMFAGRVGLLTIVLALAEGFQGNGGVRYTEEKVIIG